MLHADYINMNYTLQREMKIYHERQIFLIEVFDKVGLLYIYKLLVKYIPIEFLYRRHVDIYKIKKLNASQERESQG